MRSVRNRKSSGDQSRQWPDIKRLKRAITEWRKVKDKPRNQDLEHIPAIDGKSLSDLALQAELDVSSDVDRENSDGSTQRKPKANLRSLDPNSPAYWNEVLRREGLAMSAGEAPLRNLMYTGTFYDLEVVAGPDSADTVDRDFGNPDEKY